MNREPEDLPGRESGIRPDRTAVAHRVMEAARGIMARHEHGETIDPRHLQWADWITRFNR